MLHVERASGRDWEGDGWMMRGFMNLIEREGCGEGERGCDGAGGGVNVLLCYVMGWGYRGYRG